MFTKLIALYTLSYVQDFGSKFDNFFFSIRALNIFKRHTILMKSTENI